MSFEEDKVRIENFLLREAKHFSSEELNTVCFYMLTRMEPWWAVDGPEWLDCWKEAKKVATGIPEILN